MPSPRPIHLHLNFQAFLIILIVVPAVACAAVGQYASIVDFGFSAFLEQNDSAPKSGSSAPEPMLDALNAATASLKAAGTQEPNIPGFGVGCGGVAALVSAAMIMVLTLGPTSTESSSLQLQPASRLDMLKRVLKHVQGQPEASKSSMSGPPTLEWDAVLKSNLEQSLDSTLDSTSNGNKSSALTPREAFWSLAPPELQWRAVKPKKCVRFGDMHFREMNLEPGGGGAVCSHGTPLGMGWSVVREYSSSVYEFERFRQFEVPRHHKDRYTVDGRLSESTRLAKCRHFGVPEAKLRFSAEESARVQKERDESNADLFC